MFSGIVSGLFPVIITQKTDFGLRLELSLDKQQLEGVQLGASISVNGVCLTLSGLIPSPDSNNLMIAQFDVIGETLSRSNLKDLKKGSLVNIERSLKFGDEIGGHICSGHVDTTVRVKSIREFGGSWEIEFDLESKYKRYIFEKGFVALNGASLTVARLTDAGFLVALIPETLKRTNLGKLVVGDNVNLEIDRQTQIIVETVERITKGLK